MCKLRIPTKIYHEAGAQKYDLPKNVIEELLLDGFPIKEICYYCLSPREPCTIVWLHTV